MFWEPDIVKVVLILNTPLSSVLRLCIVSHALFLVHTLLRIILSALYIRLFVGCHNGVTLWRALPLSLRRNRGSLLKNNTVPPAE